MARRKVTNRVPPVSSMRTQRRAGSAWDREFLGANRYTPPEVPADVPGQNYRRSLVDFNAVQIQARQRTDDRLQQEITLALNGDDEKLLPYQPTATIDPSRPRTLAAGYDSNSQTLRIKFRDGTYYTYYNVPPSVWWKFERASSPGRFINSSLNNFPYNRGL
jgi:hypothetical protein